jgi:tRNA(Ile)-lysidine synthase
LLSTTRAEVESYLRAIGQDWCEDSSNRHLTFTRNRIRHELLPLLEGWNPQLREHLAQMATLARDEEAWWQAELARLAPQIVLPGRPARGGGRSAGDGLALDVTRLAALHPAMQRRLLRFAAEQLGAAVDFTATAALRALALTGRAGQKLQLAQGLRAERTARELRLRLAAEADEQSVVLAAEYTVAIPGEVVAPTFGLQLNIEVGESVKSIEARSATLRNWKPGDRVQLRHSSGLRKVKEVLERLKVTGSSRTLWPVLELNDRIVWMQGVEVEPESGIRIHSSNL